MPPLTKFEATFFITFTIVAMTMLFGIIWLLDNQPKNCWTLYTSETQAIQECEQ